MEKKITIDDIIPWLIKAREVAKTEGCYVHLYYNTETGEFFIYETHSYVDNAYALESGIEPIGAPGWVRLPCYLKYISLHSQDEHEADFWNRMAEAINEIHG